MTIFASILFSLSVLFFAAALFLLVWAWWRRGSRYWVPIDDYQRTIDALFSCQKQFETLQASATEWRAATLKCNTQFFALHKHYAKLRDYAHEADDLLKTAISFVEAGPCNCPPEVRAGANMQRCVRCVLIEQIAMHIGTGIIENLSLTEEKENAQC